jgi:hypothetical protein
MELVATKALELDLSVGSFVGHGVGTGVGLGVGRFVGDGVGGSDGFGVGLYVGLASVRARSGVGLESVDLLGMELVATKALE